MDQCNSSRINRRTERTIRPALFAVLLLAGAALSADTLKHSLPGYLEYALQHNPMIRMAQEESGAREAMVPLSVALPGPQIMAEFEKMQDMRTPSLSMVGVTQAFPWPGEAVWQHRYAQRMLSFSQQQVKEKEIMVAFDVRETYAMLYETGRVIAFNRESMQLLRQTEEIARTSYAAGKQTQSSLLRIQLEIARLEDRIRALEAEGEKLRLSLAALLPSQDAHQAPYPAELPPMIVPQSIEDIRAITREQNPTVRAAFLKASADEAMVRMERQRILPMAVVSAAYMQSIEDPDLPSLSGARFGAGLMFPLWPAGARSSLKSSLSMAQASKSGAEQEELRLVADADRWLVEYRDAQSRIRQLNGVLIPQTRQALDVMTEEYKSNMIPVAELLAMQRMLLDMQIDLVMEERRREIAAAEIVVCCLAQY